MKSNSQAVVVKIKYKRDVKDRIDRAWLLVNCGEASVFMHIMLFNNCRKMLRELFCHDNIVI